jgi:hypothetical protein
LAETTKKDNKLKHAFDSAFFVSERSCSTNQHPGAGAYCQSWPKLVSGPQVAHYFQISWITFAEAIVHRFIAAPSLGRKEVGVAPSTFVCQATRAGRCCQCALSDAQAFVRNDGNH